jgi:hypothetical protein
MSIEGFARHPSTHLKYAFLKTFESIKSSSENLPLDAHRRWFILVSCLLTY